MTKNNKHDEGGIIRDFMMEEQAKEISENQALELLMIAAEAMGWTIIVPDVDDDEEVPGLIIGKEEYVDWILDTLGDDPIPHALRMKLRRLNTDDGPEDL